MGDAVFSTVVREPQLADTPVRCRVGRLTGQVVGLKDYFGWRNELCCLPLVLIQGNLHARHANKSETDPRRVGRLTRRKLKLKRVRLRVAISIQPKGWRGERRRERSGGVGCEEAPVPVDDCSSVHGDIRGTNHCHGLKLRQSRVKNYATPNDFRQKIFCAVGCRSLV